MSIIITTGNQTCQPGECFRGTFRVKKRDLPAKSGTVGKAHIEIFFRSIRPTEINCVPKYTVARRFGRGTVLYYCEKSNGISVITFNRPLSRRLDRCDRVIQNEGDDSIGGNV